MFCVRIHKTDTIGNSKPCSLCYRFMKKSYLNIKNIYYSDGNGNIIKEAFNQIECTFITSGEKINKQRKKKKNNT